MALEAAEVVNVLRFTGRTLRSPDAAVVTTILGTLTPEEVTVVRTTYLDALLKAEAAVTGSLEDIDTKKAGPWERNTTALADLTALLQALRLGLCEFLGVEPAGLAGPVVPAVFLV